MTIPNYAILTDDDTQQIHEASLTVLQTTGLRLSHPLALEKLAAAGAEVKSSRDKVLLPPDMVARALKLFPRKFVCAGRGPEFDLVVDGQSHDPPAVRTVAGVINHFDMQSTTSRPLTLADVKDVAVLGDALDNINIVSCLTPQDLSPATYDLHTLKCLLASGRKHIWALTTDSKNLKYQLEMMAVVAGGTQALAQRPLCSGIVCLIEPLTFPDDEIERLLLYGKHGLPVRVPLVPMSGANAPYTMAGALVHTNAEALGSLVLLQTLCPGTPTWFYSIFHEMNMQRGTADYFSPQVMLTNAGLIQMARYYGLPSITLPYAASDCQAHQLMFARGAALTMYAMSGVSEIGGAGAVNGGLAVSPQAMVIDNELAGFMHLLVEGFEINSETMALETIQQVGHGGDFLSTSHTYEFLHREKHFQPNLLDWRSQIEWQQDGRTIVDRAQEKFDDILNNHTVPGLEEPMQQELSRIIQAAERELG